ncbi:hypothetical protein NPIL_175901 [Nephila pilipes]|uniref:Uncharacterized protein n=1 Tax=Nephila pilipes TaxID=299642 RepID=A0A8X6UPQ6_NEPPI|nr:hypothetical protein NPIL_175901 [Nephila pilipes]
MEKKGAANAIHLSVIDFLAQFTGTQTIVLMLRSPGVETLYNGGYTTRGLKKHLINNTGLALGTVNEAAGFSLRRCHRDGVIIQLPRINEPPIGPFLWGPQHVTLGFTLATPTRQRWHLPLKWPKVCNVHNDHRLKHALGRRD